MRKLKITLTSGHDFIVGVMDSDIEISYNVNNCYNSIQNMGDVSDQTGNDTTPIDLLVKHTFNN